MLIDFPTSLIFPSLYYSFSLLQIFLDDDIGMCGCRNGLSNYPSCETHLPNNYTKICDEDCTQYV